MAREHDRITDLLQAWTARRETGIEDRLFAAVYPRLHRLARSKLRGEAGRPLETTELVHEAYLRLVDQRRVDWRCRAHFFAMAATVIRRVLVDQARHRLRDKRGGHAVHVSVAEVDLASAAPTLDLLDLDQALVELATIRQTAARVIELRFFAGLSIDDTAVVLGRGRTTVVRQWRFARAWLSHRLRLESTA